LLTESRENARKKAAVTGLQPVTVVDRLELTLAGKFKTHREGFCRTGTVLTVAGSAIADDLKK
jgi:hypothetical protein